MTDLQTLTAQRDDLLEKIREIEETCEGIENENNAQRVQALNLEHAQLSAQKQELSAKLSALESRLSAISSEITKLSGTGIDRILDSINEQDWYYFKNKPNIIFNKKHGLIWTNKYYDFSSSQDENTLNNIREESICIDGYKKWKFCDQTKYELLILDTSFPETVNDKAIYGISGTALKKGNKVEYVWTDNDYPRHQRDSYIQITGSIIFYNTSLFDNDDCCNEYKKKVSENNPIYTEKERLQFTLDLFVQNDLFPIFNDEEITELYKKIYYEKPKLIEQLQELQTEIESMQTVTLLSSTFDYTALLAKYDIKAIDSSIIKYYQAVQQWIEELLEKLDYYESEKEAVIRDFNVIGLKLAQKYENSKHLTEEENSLMRNRQRYFSGRFSLGMNSIKSKLLSVKHQADELEYRIDEIDNGDDAIYQLALLEKEERASFGFIAENTAKIIRNALKKIEFFEDNHQYVVWAVHAWEDWTESYRVFKTTYMEDLKGTCEEDGIEEEIWQKWYSDWQSVRFSIEEKVQPIIEKELRERIAMVEEGEISVAQQIISELEVYRDAVDTFYKKERKNIYKKFENQYNGYIREVIETESKLYKLTSQFQSDLQGIIFNCKKYEDRIYILNWANSLLDIQIDNILSINSLPKASKTILTEISELKKKNYDIYLANAKSYDEEQERRAKEFNSLILTLKNMCKK